MLRPPKHFENRSISSSEGPLDDAYGKIFIGKRARSVIAHLSTFACLLMFVGCTVGPDFASPGAPNLQLDYLAKQNVTSTATMELGQWWQAFGDPKMNGLLDRAQSQNLTLREAYERIIEARANYRFQGGQLKPNGNVTSGYSYNKNSPNSRPFVAQNAQNGNAFNLFDLGVDATWEIDLFGKIARQIEAADAELKFQENEFESIRQTLFSDIVSSYLRIRLLQSQMVLTEQSLAIQSRTDVLVTERKEAGVSTELDKSQTESFRHRTSAAYIALKQQLELEFNNLSALMGQTPDSTLRDFVGVMPIPAMPAIPNAGLPADLLRRRPDVARQELAVKAASARIGVAEADLYPQLTLIGTIGLSSTNPSGLFETNGFAFSLGPSFQWNILHFGRICDNIEVHEARFRQTIARYQESVLSAVREVEDSMINHQGNLEQWQTFNQAIEADERAVELSLERYRAGKANFQRVVDSQQQLLEDQQKSYQAQTEAIIQLVRLFKAAGGDWTIGAPAIVSADQHFTSEVIVPTETSLSQPIYSTAAPALINQYPLLEETSIQSPPLMAEPTLSTPSVPTSVLSTPILSEPDLSQSSIPAAPTFRQAMNLPFGLNVR